MTREQRLAQSFSKSMALIEIGASYNPIVPRRDGWNTTIVDHTDRAALVEKYHDQNIANIEEVDIVWREGALADQFPTHQHGTFDGLLASHVGEHIPDLIGFLNSVAKLLKPAGVLFLALPDKRLCFDFFRPVATTGDLLDGLGASRHSRGALYDNGAYFTVRGEASGWHKGGPYSPFKLVHPLDASKQWTLAQAPDGHDYIDCHKWRFTPASFQLAILELNLLRVIPWAIQRYQPTDAVEFYVWLERREIHLSDEDIAAQRLHLLREIVLETKEQVAEVEPSAATQPTMPSISAIIPLYNGQKYIEDALKSILSQTLPPKEIIVVDDGSTDNGAEVVKAMASWNPITLLTKQNGGQSSARNFGVAHATGDLIALLDQDDMWYPKHLEELVKPFLEPPDTAELGWVYSDLDEVDDKGGLVTRSFLSTLPVNHPKRTLIACLLQDMFILPSASLISRKAFNTVSGFDEKLSGYEDDDLFLRLFRAGYDNIYLQQALSKWRIFPDSYSYTYRMRRSRAVYVRKLLDEFPDDPRRNRYYQRDLILPRFYVHAVAEFRNALMADDPDRIIETRDELMFLVGKMPAKQRILGRVLSQVKSPKAATMAFAARRYVSPILRRII